MIRHSFILQIIIFICLFNSTSFVESRIAFYNNADIETGLVSTPSDSISISITRDDQKIIAVPLEKTSPTTQKEQIFKKITWKEWLAKLGPSFKEHLKSKLDFYTIYILFGLELIFFADSNHFIEQAKNFSYIDFFRTAMFQYIRYFIITAAHEGGHTFANYLTNHEVTSIHLGTNNPDDEGIEIFPRVILSTLHPSKGVSPIAHAMEKPYTEKLAAIEKLLAHFREEYPDLSSQEWKELPEFQAELKKIKALDKSWTNKFKHTFNLASGVIAGLITNGLIKFISGESVLSLDYFDIKQLINVFPMSVSDGGQIVQDVFEHPEITEQGDQWLATATFSAYFMKACTETDGLNLEKITSLNSTSKALFLAKKIMSALGFAVINFATSGIMHFPTDA